MILDNQTAWVRCGCAHTCVGLAIAKLDEIIAFTKENSF